jgi:hypothetical protein
MAQDFVPLTTTSSSGAGLNAHETLRVKVLPSSGADSQGKPLAHGAELPPLAKSPAAFAAVNQANFSPQPKITCQRDGDRITQIRIQCTCGQVIELTCDY